MQGTQQPVRVLPADVYDALELSAEAYGGIGAGEYYDRFLGGVPLCIRGHALQLEGPEEWTVSEALYAAFPHGVICLNDHAVRARVGRHGSRITFQQWAEDLNVVRGE